jgi:leucyl-tRNA synthetase
LGHQQSILLSPWPRHREDALVKDEATVVVQVNGKLRNRFVVALDTDKDVLQQMALADEKVAKFIAGKTIRKVIVIPNKLVNIVV